MYFELTALSIFGYLSSLKAEFSRESGSKKENDLPVAMDCTTLTLVDAAQSNLPLLLAENQDCGVEPKECYGGACSAASVAQNLTGLEKQHSLCTSLKVENQDCDVEAALPHEGMFSTAPVAQNEFSSSSAISN
ncbi:hypothetical protein [Nostoc sp. DedQUE09]|uniref:hypothetical protein n=1 Tax=Nostoc sp. DedQUE09 TaxID=3075394 RepID=UPI002AD2F334|nr:hypothetical protein [Nostoc sp. DedQUE09]MDZ7954833.1 hypothetical protein [Nostoc sp. DedQUE09]